MARTLEDALHKLATMTGQITITAGVHHYREGSTPHYFWEVIGSLGAGECYPAFDQDDDLRVAVENVISQIEERRASGRAFVEAHPEWKELPVAHIPKLIED
jgi:hypothetical protein